MSGIPFVSRVRGADTDDPCRDEGVNFLAAETDVGEYRAAVLAKARRSRSRGSVCSCHLDGGRWDWYQLTVFATYRGEQITV
jgi:hypothetical protein